MCSVNRLLLDTHILLWSLLEPERLDGDVAALLGDRQNEKWLSPITVWEILILADKGRIRLNDAPVAWVSNVLKTVPFRQAELNHEVAMQSVLIDLPHRDPADRFLVASAMVYDLTLVTADKNIIASAQGRFKILANR